MSWECPRCGHGTREVESLNFVVIFSKLASDNLLEGPQKELQRGCQSLPEDGEKKMGHFITILRPERGRVYQDSRTRQQSTYQGLSGITCYIRVEKGEFKEYVADRCHFGQTPSIVKQHRTQKGAPASRTLMSFLRRNYESQLHRYGKNITAGFQYAWCQNI